jgi:IS1 family transposase
LGNWEAAGKVPKKGNGLSPSVTSTHDPPEQLPGHHQHVQIEQLPRRRVIVVRDCHLDHEQRAVRGDGGAAVVQNAHRLRAKEKNLPEALRGQFGYGSVWTWTAICADCKLVPCWLLGLHDAEYGSVFMQDLARRLKHRVQLTTDGHRAYLEAIESAFGAEIDYAMLVKLYGQPQDAETRYSPAECIGTQTHRIQGNPDPAHISTSFAERQNLTMRMAMRRFTRLTNAFSKKVENLQHATSLYFMYYNFARIHSTLRVTPAMEAGISRHVWTLEEIVDLLP